MVVKPVIDLHQRLETAGYTPTDRIRDHVIARDRTCVSRGVAATPALRPGPRHPLRPRPSRPWWAYRDRQPRPAVPATSPPQDPRPVALPDDQPRVFVWTSPHGHQFLRDHTGSRPIDPSDPADPPATRPTTDHTAPHPADHTAAGSQARLWSAVCALGPRILSTRDAGKTLIAAPPLDGDVRLGSDQRPRLRTNLSRSAAVSSLSLSIVPFGSRPPSCSQLLMRCCRPMPRLMTRVSTSSKNNVQIMCLRGSAHAPCADLVSHETVSANPGKSGTGCLGFFSKRLARSHPISAARTLAQSRRMSGVRLGDALSGGSTCG